MGGDGGGVVGFVGLDLFSFELASSLLRSGFKVQAFEISTEMVEKFTELGGCKCDSPADVGKGAAAVVVLLSHPDQIEDVIFGEEGVMKGLQKGAVLLLSSTISPMHLQKLEKQLAEGREHIFVVDAYVLKGMSELLDGKLMIIASGRSDSITRAQPYLTAMCQKLYTFEGEIGAGSKVKMVNELLEGIHLVAAVEAISLGSQAGVHPWILYDIISNAAGNSWIYKNHIPLLLKSDIDGRFLDVLSQNLGIVEDKAKSLPFPVPLLAVARQQLILGISQMHGDDTATSLAKIWEKVLGVGILEAASKELYKPEDLAKEITSQAKPVKRIGFIGLGAMGFGMAAHLLKSNFSVRGYDKPACFFILTNSRSLSSEKASALIKDICSNICAASKEADNADYTIVLRGDSTLRGHFPQEADAAVSVLGEMDAWIICPFFLQGGRYTIDDVHYVADSDRLVPAGETEFAKDASFGYKSSNLREWVEEKTAGTIPANSVESISIQLLRIGGPDAVCEFLCSLKKGSACIVNAASDRDMSVFAAGMIQAEQKGKSFLCRTAASFVSARIGIIPKDLVLPKDFASDKESSGALIVVGSYVPKTTKQVEELQSQHKQKLRSIEISVEKVALKSSEVRAAEISRAVEMADAFLRAGRETLIMSSRELITGKTSSESLDINSKVSSALVEVVSQITTRPRYILAKGGITSSDTATKALKARRALVIGQALAGVPVWKLGPESRHPGVPYIVFPGNVGSSTALAEVVKSWSVVAGRSTKELLLNAENGGYAIGAFNVYNLEGIEAVVEAAEEENSPAILQVHPGAFKHGGIPLVSCCISAAEQARVPISVHFDHGTTKHELLEALELGFDSVMVDGSHLSFTENVTYTKSITELARSRNIMVEAELGRLSGTEDGLTVEDYEAKLTSVHQAHEFMETGIDALAVCIGNVHGKYPESGPNLKLDLLKELHNLSSKKGVFLVLHGASGLPEKLIKECIENGVSKFNVNTEVRKAYMDALTSSKKTDLVDLMSATKTAMKAVIADKIRLFGSAGKA
ncbi:hypothetical protein N665_0665s0010 [Sinapis alba]|nr:hypothetical protein N665_0665s0010 [Sinapis alba]